MEKNINFEDNIFILNTRIRMIRDLLLLDADPDLFLEKTLNDLDFIGNTLSILLDNLGSNPHYIGKDEQFHNLTETERLFSEEIKEIINGEGSISAKEFPLIQERMLVLWNQSQERQKTTENFFFSEDESPTMEPLVSSNELSELLRDMK
ncbi:MAG: hypothetical protein LBT16_14705 [Treponema sp.]|jgi:hypothetical protein|nr:hypothetical protein [Treponema sp.]